MKIMTTNRISDKCIFPYVNNKSLLRRMWHLSSHCLLLVLGVCFVSLWPVPTVHSYYKKGFSCLFPKVNTLESISIFCLWGRSSHIYQIQSLCYASCRFLLLLIIYTKPVHTYSRLVACFWRDVHIEKRSNTQWSESLQSQCDKMGGCGVTSILDTCLVQYMQLSTLIQPYGPRNEAMTFCIKPRVTAIVSSLL